MSSGREAAERIKLQQEELKRRENHSVANQASLTAGIRPFWQQIRHSMARELEAFKEGIRPHADTLQAQSPNSNNFTVYWSGLITLVVILDEQAKTLESTFHNHNDELEERRISALDYDVVRGVTVGGRTAEQIADDLLKPLFDTYLPSGARG